MLAIPGLDGRLLYNRLTDPDSVTWTSQGSTPATCGYEVRLCRISTHGVHHPSESALWSLTILNSMPDSSTTALPILIPSPGRHWAQRQLYAGIKRVLRCQFSMELYGPGGGKRRGGRGGVDGGVFNMLYIRRIEDC